MKRILCVGAGLFVALLSLPAFSQTDRTGAIAVRAQDSTGAVIPGVEVSVASPAMIGGERKEVTDETGTYRFTLLPPGTYTVTFALPGFKTTKFEAVELNATVTRTITATMEVASTATELTIMGTAAAIDLESATVGVNISQKMMDELPWSRSLTGMSMMIPGTYSTSFDIGNSSFGTSSTIAARSGGRSGGNVVTIDGLVWCQTYSDYGSFEEMNVSTNAKGADQMNSGITIAMVAKAGGNSFHGNFTTKYQNGSMQSNNVTQDLLDRGFPAGSNKYTHFTDYYGDIGGPILKNKLWFYGAYRQGYQGTFIPGFRTAVGGELTEFFTVLKSPTAKLTYQMTSKQKLEAYVSIPDKFQPYRGGGALVPRDATQDQDSWSSQGPVLTYTNIIDSKTSLTAKIARGGYWWPAYTYGLPDGMGPNIFVNGRTQRIPTVPNWLGVKNVGVRISDNTTGATDGGFQSNYSRPIRWQYNLDLSRFARVLGKNNEFKVGYMGWWDKDYTINFGYPYYQSYTYRSASTDKCFDKAGNEITEICDNLFKTPYRVTVSDTPNNNSDLSTYKSAYFNDKITVNRKLTVNIGLRWDHTASFVPPQGNDGTGPWSQKFAIAQKQNFINNPDGSKVVFPTYNLFEPRISFAYDLTGTGRIAIKASYGKYGGLTSSPGSTLGPGGSNVNPFGTTSCTYNSWDGTIPWDAKTKGFGPDRIMGTSDDVNLNASCLQVGPNASGQIAPVRTYRFGSNLNAAFLTEYAGGLEVALTRDYSIRFNFSRKFDVPGTRTTNNNTPYEAYTSITSADDPGRDGKLGTSDDNPYGRIFYYSVPDSYVNPASRATRLSPTNQTWVNVDRGSNEGVSHYTGYNVDFNKNYSNKWQMLVGYAISLAHGGNTNPLTPNARLYPNSMAQSLPGHNKAWDVTWHHSLKMSGQYGLPDVPLLFGYKLAGVSWSSTFTAQTGEWYGRSAEVRDVRNQTQSVTVENHWGRFPALSDWDQSIRKKFKVAEGKSLEFTWELFNTMNANTIRNWRSTSTANSNYLQPKGPRNDGTEPLRPGSILAPRIYEWGVAFKF